MVYSKIKKQKQEIRSLQKIIMLYGRKCLTSLKEQQKRVLKNQKGVGCNPRKNWQCSEKFQKAIKPGKKKEIKEAAN